MNELSTIEGWLRNAFSQYNFLKELYLIGSILSKENLVANDVDIIQRIFFEKGDGINAYLQNLKIIKEEFYNTFSKSLHITTFTQNENLDFEQFISINEHLKIF